MASDTGTSRRLPSCASLPLTAIVATPTSTLLAGESPASMCAVRFMDADDPALSAPLPSICIERVAASSASTSISPPNCITAGPTLVFTVPL